MSSRTLTRVGELADITYQYDFRFSWSNNWRPCLQNALPSLMVESKHDLYLATEKLVSSRGNTRNPRPRSMLPPQKKTLPQNLVAINRQPFPTLQVVTYRIFHGRNSLCRLCPTEKNMSMQHRSWQQGGALRSYFRACEEADCSQIVAPKSCGPEIFTQVDRLCLPSRREKGSAVVPAEPERSDSSRRSEGRAATWGCVPTNHESCNIRYGS